MATFPSRGQKAPAYWDAQLKAYIDEGDDIPGPVPDLRGLSTTSATIATSVPLTFVIDPAMNAAFPVGATVKAQASGNNYMVGNVTASTPTSVTLDVLEAGGAGTFNSWILVIGAFRGEDGSMTGPGSSVSGNLPTFLGTSGLTLQDSGIAASNLVLRTGTQTVAGLKTFSNLLTVNNGGLDLSLLPGAADHAYMGFFARTASPTTRSGYLGFGSGATTTMTFANEIANGQMTFTTAAAGTGPIVLSAANSTILTVDPTIGASVTKAGSQASVVRITSTGLTASTGPQYGLLIDPTINQTGTAGYTGLRVNVTETAVGSGTKRLLDLAVGGTTRFVVNNAGRVTVTPTLAADWAHAVYVGTETQPRLYIDGAGVINLGMGGSTATDTNLYRASADLLRTDDSFEVGIALNVPRINLGLSYAGNASVEMGRTDGVASTPFIDFHSGATPVDFDTRILASGGSGSNGGGILAFYGSRIDAYGTFYNAPTMTATVLENAFTIQPTINQSGAGGYRGLLINAIETATGTGTKRLLELAVGGSNRFMVYSTGTIQTGTATGSTGLLAAYVTGDTQPSFLLATNGVMTWGPGGSTAVDTNLYRSAANTLKTDHTFNAVTQLQENGQRVYSPNNRPVAIGTPASAAAAGAAGQQMADTNYLYTCVATNTWRRVAHAAW